MIAELEELQARAEEEIDAARTEEALLAVRTKYLGRIGAADCHPASHRHGSTRGAAAHR
jgi:hypothetical protein